MRKLGHSGHSILKRRVDVCSFETRCPPRPRAGGWNVFAPARGRASPVYRGTQGYWDALFLVTGAPVASAVEGVGPDEVQHPSIHAQSVRERAAGIWPAAHGTD